MKKIMLPSILLMTAINSFAALSEQDIASVKTALTDSLGTVTSLAVAAFGILAAIWGIRKITKMLNKS